MHAVARNWATFAGTDGFSHISQFMAGASEHRPGKPRCNVLSKSSASPLAALASTFAVAGAMHRQVGPLASSICAPSGWARCRRTCVRATGRPESAANVAGPTNSRAAAVMTTVTPAPAWTNWLTSAGRLVGRDAAADADDQLTPGHSITSQVEFRGPPPASSPVILD